MLLQSRDWLHGIGFMLWALLSGGCLLFTGILHDCFHEKDSKLVFLKKSYRGKGRFMDNRWGLFWDVYLFWSQKRPHAAIIQKCFIDFVCNLFIMGIINQSVYENGEWFKNLFLFVWIILIMNSRNWNPKIMILIFLKVNMNIKGQKSAPNRFLRYGGLDLTLKDTFTETFKSFLRYKNVS